MNFVSDEQRKAVMASLRARGLLYRRSYKSYVWPQSIHIAESTLKQTRAGKKGQNIKLPQFKKVQCPYCDKLFKKESYRDQHISDVHPNVKTANEYHGTTEQFKKVKCLYCYRLFKTEPGRDNHIRDMHPNVKTANEYHGTAEKAGKDNEYLGNFMCNNCGAKFTSRKEFEEHVAASKFR